MDLFGTDSNANLLPCDGIANYYGTIFTPAQSAALYAALLRDVPWKNDETILFGKHIVTARKIAWFGDRDFSYTYSGITRHAQRWTPPLTELKTKIETVSGFTYNSCLLNLYHDGNEGMSWHSDDEKSLVRHAPIASLSLGAERKFSFKHKRLSDSISTILENGSLLVMRGETQSHWLHCVPKSKKIATPRISLTFRTMVIR